MRPDQAALIDRRLYLSEDWVTNKRRSPSIFIPNEVTFAHKSHIARQLIAAALNAGVPCSWVLASAAYGSYDELRRELEERKQSYVLAFLRSELRVEPSGPNLGEWETLAASDYEWARASVSWHDETEFDH